MALIFSFSSTAKETDDSLAFKSLSQKDFEVVAKELDIPVAAIRAVVSIEAGAKGEGFISPHKPIINFDVTMFRQALRRRGINIASAQKQQPTAFQPLNRKKFGTTQAAQYARLEAAMKIDTVAAYEGTFWGMFQIGGFNWKTCGCTSAQEFVQRMSASEFNQLELFGKFLKARGLDKYIRNRQWAQFALRYNGPGYAKRGYHTRMTRAYAKYSAESDSKGSK